MATRRLPRISLQLITHLPAITMPGLVRLASASATTGDRLGASEQFNFASLAEATPLLFSVQRHTTPDKYYD